LRKRNLGEPKGDEAGHAFENFILMELLAYKSYKNLNFSLFFWRTKTGLEVDFVMQEKEDVCAIEVKLSRRIDKSDLKGLLAFSQELTVSKCYVVCLEPRRRLVEIETLKIEIVPYAEFLKDLWSGGAALRS
jgi:predicted AAA+ superfamily ATPase